MSRKPILKKATLLFLASYDRTSGPVRKQKGTIGQGVEFGRSSAGTSENLASSHIRTQQLPISLFVRSS